MGPKFLKFMLKIISMRSGDLNVRHVLGRFEFDSLVESDQKI